MSRQLLIVSAAALLTVSCPVDAHEFWISCEMQSTSAGDLLRVQLNHGERFNGNVVRRDDARIERFELVEASGATPILGRDGARSSYGPMANDGLGVVVYQSVAAPHTLKAVPFEDYLREEGMGWVVGERERLGEREENGREEYIRCAKAVVNVGTSAEPDREVGLPLEIVLVSLEGGLVRARVLFEGEAIEGLSVVCAGADAPDALVRGTTNEKGLVELEPPEGTEPWMLTTIHMIRLPEGHDAQWRSYWASTVFEGM